jgi:hypothetical protein
MLRTSEMCTVEETEVGMQADSGKVRKVGQELSRTHGEGIKMEWTVART